MILQQLSILNYKNIRQADLELSPKMNCFIGHNGEGKTNLLDAICFLSLCKSATGGMDSQCVCHDEEFAVVQGHYVHEGGTAEEIYLGIKRGAKKQLKRNKKPYKRLAEHIGLIPLVMVSPLDAMLIAGGSEERRRFMDIVISQTDRNYIDALMNYNKALLQRNALLKQEEPAPDEELLGLWEEEMARYGQVVYEARERYVREFQPIFQQIYAYLSLEREEVGLRYVSHAQRGPLLDVIRRDRAKDLVMGYSLHGVHKDDLEMTLGGFPIKREGSQGQNKTYLIALKLLSSISSSAQAAVPHRCCCSMTSLTNWMPTAWNASCGWWLGTATDRYSSRTRIATTSTRFCRAWAVTIACSTFKKGGFHHEKAEGRSRGIARATVPARGGAGDTLQRIPPRRGLARGDGRGNCALHQGRADSQSCVVREADLVGCAQ